jgi:pimeloyl-ACP methyl ester carboxylesterase
MMDFASLLGDTGGLNRRRFFVSDKEARWYTSSFDEIATQLNLLSDRPKVLIGNSMGGYAALQFASRLDGVVGVLAFAPQSQPKPAILDELPRPRVQWIVSPRSSDARHCIIFGELEDQRHKKKIDRMYGDNPFYTLCRLPNCGHNVVEYLHSRGLLTEALGSTTDPMTMGATVAGLTAKVEPSEEDRLVRIDFRKKEVGEKEKEAAPQGAASPACFMIAAPCEERCRYHSLLKVFCLNRFI